MAKLLIQGKSANQADNRNDGGKKAPAKLAIQGADANYAGKKSPRTPNPPKLQIQGAGSNYAGQQVSKKKIAGVGS